MVATKVVTTKTDESGTQVVHTHQKVRTWMQVVVSLIMLSAGILILTAPNFIFRHNFDEATKRFAAGWIGAIIGYWLS